MRTKRIIDTEVPRSRGFFLAVFMPLLMLLTGCFKDNYETSPNDRLDVLVECVVPGNNYASRGLSANSEDAIQDFTALLFEDGKLLLHSDGDPVLGESQTTFKVTLMLGTYEVVFLANASKWLNEFYGGRIPVDTDRAEIEEILSFSLGNDNKWKAIDGNNYDPLPMIADTTLTIPGYAKFTDIMLTRSLAKINVSVDDEKVKNFQLETIYLYRYNRTGYFFENAYKTNPVRKTTASQKVSFGTGLNEIYLFEAENPESTQSSPYPPEERIALVVAGYYEGIPALSYYRVDFKNKDGDYLPIIRNTHYNVSIISVADHGWPDPDLAYHGIDSDIEIELVGWEDVDVPGWGA